MERKTNPPIQPWQGAAANPDDAMEEDLIDLE